MSDSKVSGNLSGAFEDFGDRAISALRRGLSEKFFLANEKYIFIFGKIFAFMALLHVTIFVLYYSAKVDSFRLFMAGIGGVFAAVICLYLALRFIHATGRSIQNSSSRISNASIFDMLALVSIVGGFTSFIALAYLSFQTETPKTFFVGSGVFIYSAYSAAIFLNPNLINVQVVETQSAGGDALAILGISVKVAARVSAIALGSWIIFGELLLLTVSFNLSKGGLDTLLSFDFVGSIWFFASALIYPIVAYFTLIFGLLYIEIATAIMAIPSRLEALAKIVRFNSAPNKQ